MLFNFLHLVGAIATIGVLIGLAFLLPEENGKLDRTSSHFRFLPLFSAIWLFGAFGNLVSTLADLFETNISSVFERTMLWSYVTQTSLGRLQVLETLGALLILLLSNFLKKNGGALLALVLASVALSAPIFLSHSSSLGSHGLAIGSLIIHVIALSYWIGAVLSYALMKDVDRNLALPRLNAISLWCVIAVITSGAANAWTRLRFSEEWFSRYGALIALKVMILSGVLLIAARLRKGRDGAWLKIEIALLITITGIGSILNRFIPTTSTSTSPDRVTEITGTPMPLSPTFSRISLEYEADALILGFLIFITALYIKGVVTISRRGDTWPKGRTISFAVAIALIDWATSGGLGLYARFSFQYHMIAHMILSMVAPIFLVLSAPITLALRALPAGRVKGERGLRGLVVSALHSLPSKTWSHPIVALVIFDGSLFALYFTPLFGELMSNHFGHLLMNFHFIAAGLLFFYIIVGIDPNPRRIHHLVRIVILFAAMSIHAFFSVALMSSSTLIDNGYYQLLNRPWATDLLADQRVGAAIGWAMGEIPIIIALIATFIQWMRSDNREAKRADRRSETDLAEYNKYLSGLASRDEEK